MNIQDWERRIKSAKFHVENAKTDFDKQVSQYDLRLLNVEFLRAWSAWLDEHKAETERIFEARLAQKNQINAALQLLEDELTQVKIFAIINPAKTK